MKTVAFSAFDLLHASYVKMLEEAKRECDYLICCLQTYSTICSLAKGDEYAGENFRVREYCETKGVALFYNKREHRFSSSELRKEVAEKESLKVKK